MNAIERYWAGRPLPKDVCPASALQYAFGRDGDDDVLQAWVDQLARLHAHLANLALIPALRGGFRARNARRRAYYRRSFVPEWYRCVECGASDCTYGPAWPMYVGGCSITLLCWAPGGCGKLTQRHRTDVPPPDPRP